VEEAPDWSPTNLVSYLVEAVNLPNSDSNLKALATYSWPLVDEPVFMSIRFPSLMLSTSTLREVYSLSIERVESWNSTLFQPENP
jgi:hypothetical protein